MRKIVSCASISDPHLEPSREPPLPTTAQRPLTSRETNLLPCAGSIGWVTGKDAGHRLMKMSGLAKSHVSKLAWMFGAHAPTLSKSFKGAILRVTSLHLYW
jgi:hypothetical protein